MANNPPKITIDFETRSALPIDHGAWLYSKHHTTSVMCLAYKIGDAPTRLWHPAYPHLGIEQSPDPVDLWEAIADGWLVEAHNRFFEYCIWTHQMMVKFGWPAIPEASWRCSAAKAAYHSLPRSLDGAVAALDLPVKKDMEGSALMKKLSKPKKLLKAERKALIDAGWTPEGIDAHIFWRESVEEFERLWAYCVTDVDAEHGFSEVIDDLPPSELRIWQMDQKMNLRGLKCDMPLVRAAVQLRDYEISSMNAELVDITGGAVEKGSARAKFKEWAKGQGVVLPDTQGATLDEWTKPKPGERLMELLARKGLSPLVHRALQIIREVNRTSTAKYDAFLYYVDPDDDRVRDLLMYHGAGTGRWTGKGLQVHNFPRGTLGVKDVDLLCEVILMMDRTMIRALYGEVMVALTDALRNAIVASEGKDLAVADYAAIEARVVFWLAGDDTALDVFRRGEDIYCDMATGIYGFRVTKKENPNERQFGKQGILGLGFEMGFVTFLLTCRKYDISFTEEQARRIVRDQYGVHEDKIRRYLKGDKRRIQRLEEADEDYERIMHELVLMKHTVDTYRGRYPEVTQMWRDQEDAALMACKTPGRRVKAARGRNEWVVEDGFLKTYLPSGRPLHYYDPKVVRKKTPWKNPDGSPVYKPAITFMGVDPFSKKWVRMDTYGGSLVENITQATARDLMAQAMVKAEDEGKYSVIMSVHDELVCEVDEGTGDVREFERLMAHTPGWATGCPVEAEGWIGKRYRK